jgi:hypothetical protein
MTRKRFARSSAAAAAVTLLCTGGAALAQHNHSDAAATPALVRTVREATRNLRTPADAMDAGYAPFLGCVSGPEEGAMGIHYVNGELVGDGELDASRPEALMFEPRGGAMRFVGVEFIVLVDAWHANHADPPTLGGQVFHYNGSPNRYRLPPFYELHVWAGRDNPNGTFADWNPDVVCGGS